LIFFFFLSNYPQVLPNVEQVQEMQEKDSQFDPHTGRPDQTTSHHHRFLHLRFPHLQHVSLKPDPKNWDVSPDAGPSSSTKNPAFLYVAQDQQPRRGSWTQHELGHQFAKGTAVVTQAGPSPLVKPIATSARSSSLSGGLDKSPSPARHEEKKAEPIKLSNLLTVANMNGGGMARSTGALDSFVLGAALLCTLDINVTRPSRFAVGFL
jgi:hypothetical protein